MISFDGMFDSLTTATQPPSADPPKPQYTPRKGVMYFDLETIPDYDRMDLFGLDAIPEPAKRTGMADLDVADLIVKNKLEDIKQYVAAHNPCDDWLDHLENYERSQTKPRKGLFDLIGETRNQDAAINDLRAAQKKEMSVTPEMCKIAAFGWALDCQPQSMVVGQPRSIENGEVCTERELLEQFWLLAKQARQLCGFNILGFDLPVIFVRSILLDVPHSRTFDMTPWKHEVVDLMVKRFPKFKATGLKKLCKMMGVEVPAGDVDGSQVEQLLKDDPVKVGEYVRSDVSICIAMHSMYHGLFC